MRVTLVHPCIGRRPGERYIRSWQMEPLPPATLAGLTPDDVDVRFYDDRMEDIPFDEPTDLVAISVETYTARRAYQIATEYRRRGVPVAMGGFHATLCPDEVANYAEIVVVGEAEDVWPTVIDDVRHGRYEAMYRGTGRPALAGLRPDRRIFRGKRYLPIGLVEAGRGCHFSCDFCAVQSMFNSTQTRRPIDETVSEVAGLRGEKKLFFFVDDNITSNLAQAKEWLRALAPLKIRWVSQASINAAHDEEFLDLLVKSGCQGVLIGLVEAGRGCHFSCDFCAVQSMFNSTQTRRPIDETVSEVAGLRGEKKLFFFVDDNITSNVAQAKEWLRALAPLKIRWVSQASINAAHDEEFLDLLVKSGCQGVLIGLESLDPAALAAMNKSFNTMRGGYEKALANLRRYKLRLYATFVFGYDTDTSESFARSVEFAKDSRFYIAAFNHLTPFPGTPLYARLQAEGRLLFDRWWLDDRYRYNMVPFAPKTMSPEALQRECLAARRDFYGWSSIARRGFDAVNRADPFMFRNFFPINAMLRADTNQRDGYPLGDESWQGSIVPVAH